MAPSHRNASPPEDTEVVKEVQTAIKALEDALTRANHLGIAVAWSGTRVDGLKCRFMDVSISKKLN